MRALHMHACVSSCKHRNIHSVFVKQTRGYAEHARAESPACTSFAYTCGGARACVQARLLQCADTADEAGARQKALTPILHTHVCADMYTRTHTYKHAPHAHAIMPACIPTRPHAYMHTCPHKCTHAHTRVRTHAHTCTHILNHPLTRTDQHVHAWTHTCTQELTHIVIQVVKRAAQACTGSCADAQVCKHASRRAVVTEFRHARAQAGQASRAGRQAGRQVTAKQACAWGM